MERLSKGLAAWVKEHLFATSRFSQKRDALSAALAVASHRHRERPFALRSGPSLPVARHITASVTELQMVEIRSIVVRTL
jgi:hypothetical protein